jgi:hypothetical protein
MDRTHYLEREVSRLRADLAQAEAAIGVVESGKQGAQTRAHAVSALAEARLAVRRAGRAAPWRADDLAEARDSLARAEARFGAGRSASALFFASRARRIADELEDDAARLAASPEARLVTRTRANLRKGPSQADVVLDVLPKATPVVPERRQSSWIQIRTPSGQLGWVHGSLVKAR